MAASTDTATIVRLPRKMRRPAGLQTIPRSPSYRRRIRRQQVAAAAVAFVGVVLTILSLSHLAHGIGLVTSAPVWESWAIAVGVDLGLSPGRSPNSAR